MNKLTTIYRCICMCLCMLVVLKCFLPRLNRNISLCCSQPFCLFRSAAMAIFHILFSQKAVLSVCFRKCR